MLGAAGGDVGGRRGLADFALAGVKKEYRGRGVDLVMAVAMHRALVRLRLNEAETNPELEDNLRVQSEWKHFDHVCHKRRRLYKKVLGTHPLP